MPFEEEIEEPEVEAAHSQGRRENNNAKESSSFTTSPWFKSTLTQPSATWIGSQDEPEGRQASVVALRLFSMDGPDVAGLGIAHGAIKLKRMTLTGFQSEDATFEAVVSTVSEAALRLIGQTIDGPGAPVAVDLEIQVPPPVAQKLRRSSSSDARASSPTARKALVLPRRASISFAGRSYADILRGCAEPASPRASQPVDLPVIDDHEPDEDEKSFDADFPAPSPLPSPTRQRAAKDVKSASISAGPQHSYARAQMKGHLMAGQPTNLQYAGLMSWMEWQEAHFMKTGHRRGKVYRASSLAFQVL